MIPDYLKINKEILIEAPLKKTDWMHCRLLVRKLRSSWPQSSTYSGVTAGAWNVTNAPLLFENGYRDKPNNYRPVSFALVVLVWNN